MLLSRFFKNTFLLDIVSTQFLVDFLNKIRKSYYILLSDNPLVNSFFTVYFFCISQDFLRTAF